MRNFTFNGNLPVFFANLFAIGFTKIPVLAIWLLIGLLPAKNLCAQDWSLIDEFLPQENLDSTNYLYGIAISVDGNTAVVGAEGELRNTGGAYVLEKNGGTWETVARLTASDGALGDRFGNSVAVSGTTVIVGAFGHNTDGNSSQGKAYVFERPANGWEDMTENAQLTASDGTLSDRFGTSVAVSGTTVVVGSIFHDTNDNSNQGKAYIFEQPEGGWANMTETAQLTASDGAEMDFFGTSVAISGGTVVVGSRSHDTDGIRDKGKAYVFERPENGWANMTETAQLTASDGVETEFFSESVAVSGSTVVVGAFLHDTNGNDSQGKAYVFERPTNGWVNMTETAQLTASDGAEGDGFGRSVGIADNSVVIGAIGHATNGNIRQGKAYVFERPTNGWVNMTETAQLTASDGAENDSYGISVSISGSTVAVGASRHDEGESVDVGSAYFYESPESNTTEDQSTQGRGLVGLNNYGLATAIDENTAVVGAPFEEAAKGAAYVLERNGNEWTTVARLTASDGADRDFFGGSVAVSGSVIAVSARSHETNGNRLQGKVYVFERPANGWEDITETAQLTSSDGAASDFFGVSMSISGNTVVVGATGQDVDGIQNKGKAYVFEQPENGWGNMTETAQLTASDGATSDAFGSVLSISGNVVAVGAALHDVEGIQNQGKAYVFERPESGWANMTETAQLTASDGAESDNFGSPIVISGNTVIAGARSHDTDGNLNQGKAYVFERPENGWANMTETAQLTASDGAENAVFSSELALSDSIALVGDPSGDVGGNINQGKVYIFERPESGWGNMTETAQLTAPDGAPGDLFGVSMAILGRTLLVGATHKDDAELGKDSGKAYLFSFNRLPELINTLSDQTAPSDEAFTFTFPENTFADADGDVLTYSATLEDGAELPAWLSFDATTRTFSGTPTANDSGSISIKVTADDGNGGVAEGTFTITVEPPLSLQDELLEQATNLYPNPNQGRFIVELSSDYRGKVTLQLIDVTGKLYFEKVLMKNSNRMEYPVAQDNLTGGLYLLRIVTDRAQATKRIIIGD